jgi:hypothetical protein
MKNGKSKVMVLAFFILQLSAAAFALAPGREDSPSASMLQTEKRLKVGKQDDITLTSVTKLGGFTLYPGHYVLRHKTSDGRHAMHFVSFVPYGGKQGHGRTYYPAGYSLPSSPMGRSQAAELECKVEPLGARVTRTQVFFVDENGEKRITRIEIKGENVAHLF